MASDVDSQLRAAVARRADLRCEYCLIHENDVGFHHHVDRIISRKHGGRSTLDNLALLACCAIAAKEVTLLQFIKTREK